jgi:hypothetical protein
MIADRIRLNIKPNTVVPKPEAKDDFTIKGWGKRRSQPALIYKIPNHLDAARPYEKGVTECEFEAAYNELMKSGSFTREWFNAALPACAKEGGCNFTTIGGVFQLLGIAKYSTRGTYARTKPT